MHIGATLHPDAHHPDEHRGKVLENQNITLGGVSERHSILVRDEGFSIVQLLDYFLEGFIRYPCRSFNARQCFHDISGLPIYPVIS